MKHWKLSVIAALMSGAVYAAPMNVVTSFSILGDVTKQIGGDRVAVQNLVGANQDTHAYHMTSGDIKKIRGAKLVLLNGLGLEAADVQRAVKQSKVPFAEAAKGIQALKAEEGEHHHDHEGHHHDHGEFDPHVWNDPVLMTTYAQNVANALIQADPEGKTYYQQRLGNYQVQLKKLHSDAQAAFNAVPAAKRKVLTGHDAFSYMGKRYNIEFIAPQGVSNEAEPSAKSNVKASKPCSPKTSKTRAWLTASPKKPASTSVANSTPTHSAAHLPILTSACTATTSKP